MMTRTKKEPMSEDQKRVNLLASKARYRERNRKPKTARDQRVHDWFACSCCLASIGFGSKVTSRLLGVVSVATVNERRKEAGIERFVPKSGSWKQSMSPAITALKPKEKKSYKPKINADRLYEAASLNSIREARRFPDWSYLWSREVAKVRANQKYMSMSQEDRQSRNRIILNRVKESPELIEKRRITNARWRAENAEKLKTDNAAWRSRNPSRMRAYRAKARRGSNRMKSAVRDRFRECMRRVKGGGSDDFSGLLGCSTKQLRIHLESKFKRGMSWDNYGSYWHVDHILPCASFDHHNPRHRAQCWHYTNLQPLEAAKNIEKSDRITHPQLSLLLCSTH